MGKAITLTTKQICAGFGISHVTAYNWRKGSAAKTALPVIDPEAREVRFGLADTQAWAKANAITFDKEKALAAVDAAPAAKAPHSKPLPKSDVDKKATVAKPTKAKMVPRAPAERLAAKKPAKTSAARKKAAH